MRCPKCNSTRMRRSRSRNRRERRIRFFLPVRYYRCHQCNHRVLRVTARALGEAVGRYALLGVAAVLLWRAFRFVFASLVRY